MVGNYSRVSRARYSGSARFRASWPRPLDVILLVEGSLACVLLIKKQASYRLSVGCRRSHDENTDIRDILSLLRFAYRARAPPRRFAKSRRMLFD